MIKNLIIVLNKYRYVAFPPNNVGSSNNDKDTWMPVFFFNATVLFYVLYQLAMQPGWVLGGEMWAEMATNYFPNANSTSYLVKFLATDAGYIPVPQRLIAFLGNALSFPASSIPYFYTWSSIILTAILVAVFCLSSFRNVLKNDFLRFTICISVLMVTDFETRNFINFTYFVVFFAAIITALSLAEDTKDVPAWSWFLPILMVSKPAVLSALPLMIVAALISKPRFRWVVITTIVLCMGQFLQIVISQKAGMMPFQSQDITFTSKIIATFGYFFGLLGRYLLGPFFQGNKYLFIVSGFLFFCVITFIFFNIRKRSNVLIIVGMSLLFFNILLNCFALSSAWNHDMSKLNTLSLSRHIISGFFGCIFIISGMIANLIETKNLIKKNNILTFTGATLYLVWFIFSGWFSYGVNISKEPSSPMLNSSQWQNLAVAIDSTDPVVCVPIDPFSWGGGIYGRNCSLLNPDMNWGQEYRRVNNIGENFILEIIPPLWMEKHTIVSLGILVKPVNMQTTRVSAKAIITSKDGTYHVLTGERLLSISGGLLLMTGQAGTSIENIASVKFIFNIPIDVRFITNVPIETPAILWMGQ